ncbi:MAG TPA: carbon-phosphorus lyase complex subunit PhnI, partial [Candidatus Dormibacteraeota bacterium]
MGYTTVRGRAEAIDAAARLAGLDDLAEPGSWGGRLPLLIDQVMAEAGVFEPAVAERALDQAAGDIARACSLIRAWAAVLPRYASRRADLATLRTVRRVTPGFVAPPGGQYLGASQDYAQRLLELGPPPARHPNGEAPPSRAAAPEIFPPARDSLSAEGLLAPREPAAEPVDITREAGSRTSRGALLHLLSRAESGAMTAIAYTAVRGFGALQDPTLVELKTGFLTLRVESPEGEPVAV